MGAAPIFSVVISVTLIANTHCEWPTSGSFIVSVSISDKRHAKHGYNAD